MRLEINELQNHHKIRFLIEVATSKQNNKELSVGHSGKDSKVDSCVSQGSAEGLALFFCPKFKIIHTWPVSLIKS